MTQQYILYGGELSYFTGKARAYLRWKGVDFEERQATRDIYQSIIVPRIGYPMIPLLITPGDDAIQDTSEIMDYFEDKTPNPAFVPAGPRQQVAARLLELYGDEWLVIPAMHYRWHYNRDFAYSEFGKNVMPDATPEQQFEAGKQAAQNFEGVVPMLGATPDMAPAVEASYEAFLDDLNAHLEHHDFLLGARPSIADFGLIGPLYAHLYRDPASGEIMKARAPRVVDWVLRVQKPSAEQISAMGDFVANDEIPETLLPILRRMMSEQAPCLIDLVEKLSAFKAGNPQADIPRAIGMHGFTVEGSSGQRLMISYSQWMLQRALDAVNSFDGDDRAAIDAFAADIGASDLFSIKIETPVKRENYKLVWA